MNKTEELIKLQKIYDRCIKHLSEVLEMQKTIASNQVNILANLRKINLSGFTKLKDEISVRHIVQYEPGRCIQCGVLIEGVYEYLRHPRDKSRCTSCYDSPQAKKERSKTLSSWNIEDEKVEDDEEHSLTYKSRGQV